MLSPSELETLLSSTESFRIERTLSTTNTDKFNEAICAFANDMPGSEKPGYLIIGVDDNGEPTGITVDDALLLKLTDLRNNGIIMPPPVLTVTKYTVKQRNIVIVEVLPSDRPPVAYKGRIYIRVGPRKDIATQQEQRILAERNIDRAKTWDMRACADATLDDLALDLFTLSYLPQAVAREIREANGRSIEEQLAALRFYDLKRSRPTNGAILTFGKDPLGYFSGAYVQYVRYDGTALKDSVINEQRFSGNLQLVLSSLDTLAKSICNERPFRKPDLKDATIYDYPPLALHELLMNAAIHRNYEGSTAPIQINHFSDRIELLNPGGLFGDLSQCDFPRGTSYRNPVLAEAAKTYGFVNRFGRGIAIAENELTKNDSPKLKFTFEPNYFLVIIGVRS